MKILYFSIFAFMSFIVHAKDMEPDLLGESLLKNSQFIYEVNKNCLYLLGDQEPTEQEKESCGYYQLNFGAEVDK